MLLPTPNSFKIRTFILLTLLFQPQFVVLADDVEVIHAEEIQTLSTNPETHLAAAPRDLMASLGDSITAGAFADTETAFISLPLLKLFEIGELGHEGWIALLENKRRLSWASGTKSDSHFIRINRSPAILASGRSVSVLNAAISASVASGMRAQAERILEAMRSGQYGTLRYVTLWIGSNDACAARPLAQMREELMQAFAILAKVDQKEPIRVLMPSIPKITDLGRPEIRDRRTANGYKCETIQRKVLHFCESLLSWSVPEEYAAKSAIVAERNELLRAVANEVNRAMPNLEVRFTDVPHQTELTFEMLAADCFHPNAKTQRMISELMWADQDWFK